MIFRRNKPRQSGKTSEAIELSVVLATMGQNVALGFHNEQTLYSVSKSNSYVTYLNHINKYNLPISMFSVKSDLQILRANKPDVLIVDEFELLDTQVQQVLNSYITNLNIPMYITGTSVKPIWNNDMI